MRNASGLATAVGWTVGALLQLSCSASTDSGAPNITANDSTGGASQAASDGGNQQAGDAANPDEASSTGGSAGAWPGTGGSPGTGGTTNTGGGSGSPDDSGAGGTTSTGGSSNTGGGAGSSNTGGTGGSSSNPCDDPSLVWKSANKTNYESYPAPGSDECVNYNGCAWAGEFAYCDDKMPESWVEAHNIVSVFPSNGLVRHDLCLRSGSNTIVVTAIDTCGDSDCDGCCTENLGDADRLIDIEKYTDQRWGVDDGPIQWADLGENSAACD